MSDFNKTHKEIMDIVNADPYLIIRSYYEGLIELNKRHIDDYLKDIERLERELADLEKRAAEEPKS